eukprot:scaffold13598_cov54-Phaeocystis_antarctica.AAC.4
MNELMKRGESAANAAFVTQTHKPPPPPTQCCTAYMASARLRHQSAIREDSAFHAGASHSAADRS